MADVLMALVLEIQARWAKCGGEPLDHILGYRPGGSVGHPPYIGEFNRRGKMQILVTKGESSDWIEARRADGSIERQNVPHKGPIAHDLVHFAVETELTMNRGFWGLIAGGRGPEEIIEMAKSAGHASAKRAALPDPGFVQAIQVERIVECFEAESWSGGSDNDSLRAMAAAGCAQSRVPCPELTDEAVDRVRRRLSALGEKWAALKVGETLFLDWPLDGRALA